MSSRLLKLTKSSSSWTKRLSTQSSMLKIGIDGFPNYLPRIVETTLSDKKYADVKMLKERIINIAKYETLSREPIQGNLTMFAFDALAETTDLTENKLHQIKVLAWAVELLQTCYILEDDIEDNARTRSGKPCWHQLPGVGLMAINDSGLMRSFISTMMTSNLEHTISSKVQNYMNETCFSLHIGQFMDLSLTKTKDYKKFTIEHYNLLNYYKSAVYTVKLPILLALTLCNKDSKEAYLHVDKVCTDLGILLQMQNDVMDYVDIQSASLKTSSDIQNRKCSWPAVAFLQNCDETQRKEFETCYGRSEPEKVERVRQLYNELDIPKLYRQEELRRYQAMMQHIKELPVDSLPSKEFFHKILEFLRRYTEDISPSKSYVKLH